MSFLRIVANILLSSLLIAVGLFLLTVDSYQLRGMLFASLSKYLLAAGLIFIASFSGAMALGWINGNIPKPAKSSFIFHPSYVHPVYKGQMLVRYWCLLLSAFICFVLAFALT